MRNIADRDQRDGITDAAGPGERQIVRRAPAALDGIQRGHVREVLRLFRALPRGSQPARCAEREEVARQGRGHEDGGGLKRCATRVGEQVTADMDGKDRCEKPGAQGSKQEPLGGHARLAARLFRERNCDIRVCHDEVAVEHHAP